MNTILKVLLIAKALVLLFIFVLLVMDVVEKISYRHWCKYGSAEAWAKEWLQKDNRHYFPR